MERPGRTSRATSQARTFSFLSQAADALLALTSSELSLEIARPKAFHIVYS